MNIENITVGEIIAEARRVLAEQSSYLKKKEAEVAAGKRIVSFEVISGDPWCSDGGTFILVDAFTKERLSDEIAGTVIDESLISWKPEWLLDEAFHDKVYGSWFKTFDKYPSELLGALEDTLGLEWNVLIDRFDEGP